jgi:hypothetical protein
VSGPALEGAQLQAYLRAKADAAAYAAANQDSIRAERRTARIGAVMFAMMPFNKAVTHAMPGFRRRRARDKVAKQSRKVNRP